MITPIRMVMAVIVIMMSIISADTLSAQVTFTNPPCVRVTVINNHPNCTAQLRFITAPAAWPPSVIIPPFGTVSLPVPAGGITVNGIVSAGAFFYPFNPPPPPAGVGCGPTNWWITHVTLAPMLCCFDICADPAACTITLRAAPIPPPCNP